MFLDGPDTGPRDAVHVILAGEKVTPSDSTPAPDVTQAARSDQFNVIALEALLRMKLTAFRRKDQVHVQDMLEVGLIDATWKSRLPADLADRFQSLLDTPGG
jgi:hypothetical protein